MITVYSSKSVYIYMLIHSYIIILDFLIRFPNLLMIYFKLNGSFLVTYLLCQLIYLKEDLNIQLIT